MAILRGVATALALLPFIAAQAPQVQLGNTAIIGRSIPEFGQELFGGIPFAEPPVGQLRLSNPVLKTRLGTPTFDASNFGPACLQSASVPLMSEDCLRINVLRPAGIPTGVVLPVMAWVYGGGFDFGDSSIYNASAIVAQSVIRGTPVVFVSLNYRLGPLGFPQGVEAQKRGALNLGLKDQLAALEWVQANIGLFGGDKSKVTIFGQSAGSISLSILFLNSNIKRLARAAIFESGFTATSLNFPASHREQSWANFVKDVPQCASTAGSKDTFSCLRSDSIDEATLLKAGSLADDQSGELFAWDPTIDGPGGILPDIPSKLLARGQFARLPFIAGTVLDEGTTFTPKFITTEDQIRQSIIANFTPSPFGPAVLAKSAETILQLYPDVPALGSPFGTGNETFGLSSQYKRAAAIFGDVSFQSQRRFWIQTLSKAGLKTFGYLFADPQSSDPVNGVPHASEIPYVYGALGILGGTVTPQALALSRIMVDYWVSFATSLDPNDGKGLPRPLWTQYTPSNQAIMLLNSTGTTMIPDDYRKKQIDFINSNPAVWHHRRSFST
ncbi:lipase [Pleurotus eryngii]|uniref:Carboxylic ester hydrolase n=1 Tax=Pleurotus eryngii TaxID=5323 RepID=A0A9P6A2E7_PLEER|nr:lipase [Pleurotus eryngii]